MLGILAALFAIVTQEFFSTSFSSSNPLFPFYPLLGLVIRILFISIPIVAAIFAAFATWSFSAGSWLLYRAAAEEIKEAIYIYRTVLPHDPSRQAYLEKRLSEIQRALFRNSGGESTLAEYKGPLPASHQPNDPHSDPGFHDLDGSEYVKYRLKHQLDWHNRKINQHKTTLPRLTFDAEGSFK